MAEKPRERTDAATESFMTGDASDPDQDAAEQRDLQLVSPDAIDEDVAPTKAESKVKEPTLRVMSRADYAVQVKEHTMAQPETWLVLDGDAVVGEFDTAGAAAEYVAEAG